MNSLQLVALLPFFFLASNRTSHSLPSDDWSRWGGPNRDMVSPEANWKSVGAQEALWSVDVGIGCSAASIADGRLFTRGFVVETGDQGHDLTLCLDALSGKEIWRHASPADIKNQMHDGGTLTTPVVDGAALYVIGRMGEVRAHSVEDGEVLWEHDLTQLEIDLGSFGLSSSPLVLGDAVFINVGMTLAYDKESGKELWRTKDFGYSYGTPVPFMDGKESLIAVFNAAGLVMLDAKSGEELALYEWTSEYNINAATPLVDGKRIFISTGYNEKGCALLEYGAEGFKEVWTSRSMSNLMNGCVSIDGRYYGFDVKLLKCLDAQGEELWVERGLGRGTLIAAGKRLIVISEDGDLFIAEASPDGFEPLSRVQVVDEGPCWITPSIANGLIYCRSATGQLVCLDHRADE